MTPLDLINRARSQTEVVVERVVSVPGPDLAALLQSGRPLLISELMSHPDQHSELRRFRYGHVLGQGLTKATIETWQKQHPEFRLAAAVIDLLLHVDGIHLWADLDLGRSYFGILPLTDWQSVRESSAGSMFEDFPDRTLVVSYHDNGDYYLIIDSSENRFIWFDPQSPDDSKIVAGTVEQFLDWWWNYAQELDPRVECVDAACPPQCSRSRKRQPHDG